MSEPVNSSLNRSTQSELMCIEPEADAVSVAPSSAPPQVIDLDPVIITGDAGVRTVVRQYSQTKREEAC